MQSHKRTLKDLYQCLLPSLTLHDELRASPPTPETPSAADAQAGSKPWDGWTPEGRLNWQTYAFFDAGCRMQGLDPAKEVIKDNVDFLKTSYEYRGPKPPNARPVEPVRRTTPE